MLRIHFFTNARFVKAEGIEQINTESYLLVHERSDNSASFLICIVEQSVQIR